MKRRDKEAFVAEFREQVRETPILYLTDFTGLDVKSMTELRRKLRESGADYVVVKNRLAKRALSDLEVPDLSEFLSGPTGVVVAKDGPVPPAKTLVDFAKEHDDRPAFKVGVLRASIVDEGQFERIAKLPSRDELLAELVGALQAPMAALAGVLQGKLQETVGLFESLRQQKEAAGEE